MEKQWYHHFRFLDIKTASSSSSRSHPCSSCSEDESTLGDREAHTENSPNKSSRSSSFQESSENDEAGKSCLPVEDSQEVEIEDQEIMTADVETKPLPIEECLENVLEEEMEKGTQVIAEGISEKSREHVSKEEKEKDKSKLWEGSTAKVKDKKAGPYRVEKGGKYGHWVDLPLFPCMEADFGHCILPKLGKYYCDNARVIQLFSYFSLHHIIIHVHSACCFSSIAF